MTTQDIREERKEEALTIPDLAKAAAGGPIVLPGPNGHEANLLLFVQNDAQDFRTRWEKIQTGFVDEPHKAVEQADELVASIIRRLAEVFADERRKLESEWDKTDNVSTEDLRVALRRYRSFFDRLLSF